MRKLLLTAFIMTLAVCASGQRSIDRLFDKYSDNEDFVIVRFNGNLLKFLTNCDGNDEENHHRLPSEITEVRILAQENEKLEPDNFFNLVMRDIDQDQYEEFMRVRKSDENMVVLVRAEGKRFKEFLMIAGGKDNVVIQIKGNISFEEVKNMSEEVKENHNMNLLSDKN